MKFFPISPIVLLVLFAIIPAKGIADQLDPGTTVADQEVFIQPSLLPPLIAMDDNVKSVNQAQVIISPLLNDTDPDGTKITLKRIVVQPVNGAASLEIAGGLVFYTPNLEFDGIDSLQYEIENEEGLTATAWIRITIITGIKPNQLFSPQSTNGWYIESISEYPLNRVFLFNRWGNLVYKAEGYDNSATVWDGTANSGIRPGSGYVPNGSYYYVIYLTPDQEDPIKGVVVTNGVGG